MPNLSEVLARHRVDASVFLPMTIALLRRDGAEAFADLTVRCVGIPEQSIETQTVRIEWDRAEIPTDSLAISESTITEFAACGVACVLLSTFTNLTLTSVAMSGDRFDYWLSDGRTEFGLEVSGTWDQNLDARLRAKVSQLRANPYGVAGFVVVVGFSALEAIISYELA